VRAGYQMMSRRGRGLTCEGVIDSMSRLIRTEASDTGAATC